MALLPRPDLIVETGFFSSLDGQAWTDLSSYIELDQGISTGRRRQLVFDEVSQGSWTGSFDNSLGTFNNDRTDLPYTGLIDIDVPLRMRARWPAVNTGAITNLLSDTESQGNDTDWFTPEQGQLDLETVNVPAGQTTAIIWYTGVLATTGVHLLTGDVNARSSDDLLPMYVTPGLSYTAGQKVLCDTAGTGITFKVSCRIIWYDLHGVVISENAGSLVTLTTSYQTVSVTATAPTGAYTARMALANETIVNPATATFALTGIDSSQVNNGLRMARLTPPAQANIGDLAVAYHRSNKTATFSIPTGWAQVDSFNDGRGTTQVCTKVLTQADINQPVYWDVGATGINWSGLLTTWSGQAVSSFINAHTTKTETTLTATHVTAAVTSTVANALIISMIADTSSTTSTWSLPGTDTLAVQTFGKGGNGTGGQVTYRQATTAGAYGAISYVSNIKSQYVGMSSIAVAPATGTGPGSVQVTTGAWLFVQSASLPAWSIGGHWKVLFTGLTDSWQKTFAGDLSLMYVEATDQTKTLNAGNIGSATFESIMQAVPVGYWQLNESGDQSTTQGADSSNSNQGAMMDLVWNGGGGTLSWGEGVGPAIDGQAALVTTKVSRTTGDAVQSALTDPITEADSASVSLWFNSTDSDVTGTISPAKLVNVGGGAEWAYVEIRCTSGTNVQCNVVIKSENNTYQATASYAHQIFDGKTHLLTATAQLVGGAMIATMYVDGVSQATASATCPVTAFPSLAIFTVGSAFPSSGLCNGTYSHAAIFNYCLDPDTIADMYNAGTTAYAGDTVDQRIGRICNWAGVLDLTLDSSVTLCDRHMPDVQTVLAAVQQAARTDGGTSFVADDGSVTFLSRANKENTFTPWLTIDCKYVDPALVEVTDDALLVNQAVINRLGANTTTTTQSLVSQQLHGIYNRSVDTIMQDPDDAQYAGDYLIAFYSTPEERCDQVVIDAEFINQWDVMLEQDMWLIIELQHLPTIEQSSTLDLYAEGWQIDISDTSWKYTFDTSSAIPFAVLNDTVRDVTGSFVVAW